MRDPERIGPIVDTLLAYWQEHPDLRLGQIVSNATHAAPTFADTFSIEDDDLAEGIESMREYD